MAARCGAVKVDLPSAFVAPLEAYFRLLARWNQTINLTSLPLETPTDETFDRLIVEPLVAAAHIPAAGRVWFDLGSGGGSPAIPLKIAQATLDLTMVESKIRKAAFLAEAVRALGLRDARVENRRIEETASDDSHVRRADLVTVRAVKPDRALLNASAQLLKPGGELLVFGEVSPAELDSNEFANLGPVELLSSASRLSRFRRVG